MVLALISTSEGLGMVVVEELARQRVPVVTDLLGTRDATRDGHYGLLVPLNDVEALRTHYCTHIKKRYVKARWFDQEEISWNIFSDRKAMPPNSKKSTKPHFKRMARPPREAAHILPSSHNRGFPAV